MVKFRKKGMTTAHIDDFVDGANISLMPVLEKDQNKSYFMKTAAYFAEQIANLFTPRTVDRIYASAKKEIRKQAEQEAEHEAENRRAYELIGHC